MATFASTFYNRIHPLASDCLYATVTDQRQSQLHPGNQSLTSPPSFRPVHDAHDAVTNTHEQERMGQSVGRVWDPAVVVGVGALADVQQRRRHNDKIDGVYMMDKSSRSLPTANPAAHAKSAPDNEQRMHRQIDDIMVTVSV